MSFIEKETLFKEELGSLGRVIDRQKSLPDQVFRPEFKFFWFADSGFVYTDEFYNDIVKFLKVLGNNMLMACALSLDIESYYRKHFQQFPLIEIPIDETSDFYLTALQHDPHNKPNAALAFNGALGLYSMNSDWFLYIDDEFELCIAAFKRKEISVLFKGSMQEVPWVTYQEAIDSFYRLNELSPDVKRALTKNYSNQSTLPPGLAGQPQS